MPDFQIIFEFRTYVNQKIEDVYKTLSFIPFPGMNIWFDEKDGVVLENKPLSGWFKVESTDYLLKENVFVISLQEENDYIVEEEI